MMVFVPYLLGLLPSNPAPEAEHVRQEDARLVKAVQPEQAGQEDDDRRVERERRRRNLQPDVRRRGRRREESHHHR